MTCHASRTKITILTWKKAYEHILARAGLAEHTLCYYASEENGSSDGEKQC